MESQPEKQPKTFEQLMGQLSKVKQYPIDLQPINPAPPEADKQRLSQAEGQGEG
ncbi:MAG: hypothetical protein MK161_00285 [Pirellulales bacterium]|nr:hypothetical protein [Pirellulales bacterium]